jgi:hypothetical protein
VFEENGRPEESGARERDSMPGVRSHPAHAKEALRTFASARRPSAVRTVLLARRVQRLRLLPHPSAEGRHLCCSVSTGDRSGSRSDPLLSWLTEEPCSRPLTSSWSPPAALRSSVVRRACLTPVLRSQAGELVAGTRGEMHPHYAVGLRARHPSVCPGRDLGGRPRRCPSGVRSGRCGRHVPAGHQHGRKHESGTQLQIAVP